MGIFPICGNPLNIIIYLNIVLYDSVYFHFIFIFLINGLLFLIEVFYLSFYDAV